MEFDPQLANTILLYLINPTSNKSSERMGEYLSVSHLIIKYHITKIHELEPGLFKLHNWGDSSINVMINNVSDIQDFLELGGFDLRIEANANVIKNAITDGKKDSMGMLRIFFEHPIISGIIAAIVMLFITAYFQKWIPMLH